MAKERNKTNDVPNPSTPPRLLRPAIEVASRLSKQIEEAKSHLKTWETISCEIEYRNLSSTVKIWHDYNVELIRTLFSGDEQWHKCQSSGYRRALFSLDETWRDWYNDLGSDIRHKLQFLESLFNRLDLYKEDLPANSERSTCVGDTLKIVFERFHSFCRELKHRHDGRSTIEIQDEYDVQDVLRALLKLFFDDIREEEWTPSYAGSASRIDFLLKENKTIIEVKKTRASLKDRKLGDELIIDCTRYKSHPDVKELHCFIYDPSEEVKNPTSLQVDLEKVSSPELAVKVWIRPKR